MTVTKWVSATHPTISSSPRELFQRSAAASRRCILKSFWSRDREKWSRGQRSRPMASSPWLIPGERHMLHCSRPALRVGKVSVTYRWGQMDQERRRRPAGCSGWRGRGGGAQCPQAHLGDGPRGEKYHQLNEAVASVHRSCCRTVLKETRGAAWTLNLCY